MVPAGYLKSGTTGIVRLSVFYSIDCRVTTIFVWISLQWMNIWEDLVLEMVGS